jgi:hypothetical protein
VIDLCLERTRREAVRGWVGSFDPDDLAVLDADLDAEIAALALEPHPDPIGSLVFDIVVETDRR